MAEKIFINSKKLGTIECPKCNKHWEKDFSQFKDFSNANGFTCKCPCGHSFPIVLERRRHNRKLANLNGSYVNNKSKVRGLINIKNISKSGVALEYNTKQHIPKGNKLLLKFNLNDAKKSYLCKEAVIKKADGTTVGLEFTDTGSDEDLEIYLKE